MTQDITGTNVCFVVIKAYTTLVYGNGLGVQQLRVNLTQDITGMSCVDIYVELTM